MALSRKDRVQDSTTTTGTGTINLTATAPNGFRTFVSAVATGDTVRYMIESTDKSEWEVGEGVFTDGSPDTLTRVTVYASSNAGALVSFSAGTKKVSLVLTAIDVNKVATRTETVASSATPSINTDVTDVFTITALAAAITSMTTNLTGTPVNGQKLIIRIKDNGTARAITWGASFANRGATLPTTTVINKTVYVGLMYNSTAAIWDCIAVSQEV